MELSLTNMRSWGFAFALALGGCGDDTQPSGCQDTSCIDARVQPDLGMPLDLTMTATPDLAAGPPDLTPLDLAQPPDMTLIPDLNTAMCIPLGSPCMMNAQCCIASDGTFTTANVCTVTGDGGNHCCQSGGFPCTTDEQCCPGEDNAQHCVNNVCDQV